MNIFQEHIIKWKFVSNISLNVNLSVTYHYMIIFQNPMITLHVIILTKGKGKIIRVLRDQFHFFLFENKKERKERKGVQWHTQEVITMNRSGSDTHSCFNCPNRNHWLPFLVKIP